MDIHKAFQIGAQRLAEDNCRYADIHKAHGIDQAHWDLLTSSEYWTAEESRQIRPIIQAVAEASMTIASMPALPLPGHYLAALIAHVVKPVNQLIACTKVPETYDAITAAGLDKETELQTMTYQQMTGLVMAYSGGYVGEPAKGRLPKDLKQIVQKEIQNVG